MRENSVEVPEPPEKGALDPAEGAKSQTGLPGPRRERPPVSRVRAARGIVEPMKSGRGQKTAFLSRHAAKCRICSHPDRAAIEFDFLNWRNPFDLVQAYNLRSLTTIYRHAHATGLIHRRRLNLRFALERIVERVGEVPVTATAVIKAARAVSRINDSGEWVDPPSRVIVTHLSPEEAADPAGPAPRRRKRSRGQQGVRPSRTARHSLVPRESAGSLAPVFDDALFDEPSESAQALGEMRKINGKTAPPEYTLMLSPEFQKAREEYRRSMEADRQANAAKNAAFIEELRRELDAKAGRGAGSQFVRDNSPQIPAARAGVASPASQPEGLILSQVERQRRPSGPDQNKREEKS
jgi:hypothetical protein